MMSASQSTSEEGEERGEGEGKVTWFTFYSHREKREYYYEPISGTTTWVAPRRSHGVISHLPGSPDESNSDLSLYQRKVLPFITRPTVAVSMFLFNLMLLFAWLQTGSSGLSSQNQNLSPWTPPLPIEPHDERHVQIDLSMDVTPTENHHEAEESFVLQDLDLQPARSPPVPLPSQATVVDEDWTERVDDDSAMQAEDLLESTASTNEGDEAQPVASEADVIPKSTSVDTSTHSARSFDQDGTPEAHSQMDDRDHDALPREILEPEATEPIYSDMDGHDGPLDIDKESIPTAESSDLGSESQENAISEGFEVDTIDAVGETHEVPIVPVEYVVSSSDGGVGTETMTLDKSHGLASEDEATEALDIEFSVTYSDVLLEKVLTSAITAGFTIDREPEGDREVVLRPLEEIVSTGEGIEEKGLCGNKMAKLLLPHCREHVSST